MEYIFGTRLYDGKQCEYVKIVGDRHEELENGKFYSHEIKNPLMTIIHKFRVLYRFKANQDLQGKYCTWYYIDNHTTDIDRTPSINATLLEQQEELRKQNATLENILIDLLNANNNDK